MGLGTQDNDDWCGMLIRNHEINGYVHVHLSDIHVGFHSNQVGY